MNGSKFHDALNDDADSMPTALDLVPTSLPPRRQPQVVEKEVVVYQDNPNAIQRHEDGSMTYKRFKMTKVGLTVPDDVTADELFDLGQTVYGLQSSLQWIIGDLMNSMQRVWGESYQQVAIQLGYEVKTVKEWASICRKVSIRMDTLTFGHHQVVAPYEPEEQRQFLEWASHSGATISSLRKAIAEWKNPPKQLKLNLKFSEDVIEGERDSYTQLTRIRNAIKGQQSLTPDEVLADALKLKAFAEKIIRDMGGN